MNEVVRLPIHIDDVGTTTECWTYNRLAIIKTSPYFRDWVAAHYALFVDINNYNFLFGEISCYTPSIYQPILECTQIHLFHLQKCNVVDVLKEQIRGGAYIVATLRFNDKHQKVHEVLLFGFDDVNKAFLSVELKNGVFTETTILYSYVEDTMETIKKHFLRNSCAGVKLSLLYQYPFSSIRLKNDYDFHYCAFETYRKLVLEVNSKDIIQKSRFNFEICDDRDYAYIITGVKCTLIFGQMLQEFVEGKDLGPWFNGVVIASQKIYEHKKMILFSMEYLVDKWSEASSNVAQKCLKEYKEYVTLSEKWKNMCIKFHMTGDKKLLQRICDETLTIYEREESCLLNFVNNGFDWDMFNELFI